MLSSENTSSQAEHFHVETCAPWTVEIRTGINGSCQRVAITFNQACKGAEKQVPRERLSSG
jgi:hypothetical protein